MRIVEWIMLIFGVSELEAILIFEVVFLFLILIIGYIGVKNYEKLMGLKQENEQSIPNTIRNDYVTTQKMIMSHLDPKFSKLPLYKQIRQLHREQLNNKSKPILIEVEPILQFNLPSEVVSGINVCLICKSKFSVLEEFGYYTCCFEMSHFDHVNIWHRKSTNCPFCRQPAGFRLIVKEKNEQLQLHN